MGCGSQTGCLGPKPRQREVYLDMVQTIQNQARELQIPPSQDPYLYVQARLNKKGLLRKLIDNLNSHKANLYECSNQVLDLTVKSNTKAEHASSLIVVNRIVEQFFKEQEEDLNKQKSQKMPIHPEVLNAILQLSLPYNELSADIVQRLNIIYFKIIIVLMEKERTLHKNILQSLKTFLSMKTDKLLCKGQIFLLFELLMENIQNGDHLQESAQVFAELLRRLKQNFYNEINPSYVVFFIKKWFYQDQNEPKAVRQAWRNIIKEYMESFFGNTESIVLTFINILDQVCFQPKETIKVEEFILHIFRNEESSRSFLRSMSLFLVKYLHMGQELSEVDPTFSKLKHIQNPKCQLNCFKMLTKWIKEGYFTINTMIEYNPSALVYFYISNIEKSHSENYKAELKSLYFQAIEVVSPQSIIILTQFLASEIKLKTITKHRRDLLYSLLQQILKIKESLLHDERYNSKIRIILSLKRHYSKQFRLQLLSYASRNVKTLNILKIKSIPESNESLRIRLCKFLYSIFDIIIGTYEKTDATSERSLSLTDESSNKIGKITSLHKFVSEVFKVLRVFNDIHLHSYLLAFSEHINCYLCDLSPEQDGKDAIILFFLDYLIESIVFLMNKKERISQPISKLSLSMDKEALTHDIKRQITEASNEILKPIQVLGQFDQTEEVETPQSKKRFLKERNERKINATKELHLIQEEQFSEIVEQFRLHFREPLKQSRRTVEPQIFAEKDFNRQPSLNVTLDQLGTDKGSLKNEGEEGFRQIMDKLREQ